jgi:hypothetical protein
MRVPSKFEAEQRRLASISVIAPIVSPSARYECSMYTTVWMTSYSVRPTAISQIYFWGWRDFCLSFSCRSIWWPLASIEKNHTRRRPAPTAPCDECAQWSAQRNLAARKVEKKIFGPPRRRWFLTTHRDQGAFRSDSRRDERRMNQGSEIYLEFILSDYLCVSVKRLNFRALSDKRLWTALNGKRLKSRTTYCGQNLRLIYEISCI